MRVAMLGMKGIPATYGGVERYTEEVATRLAARGHDIIVYCRGHYTPRAMTRQRYRGVRLVRLPSLNLKVTDTLSHSFLATVHLLSQRCDAVVYHSLGNAMFACLPRLVGTPTALVLHGQEWREEKWRGLPRRLFLLSERAAFLLSTRVCSIARWLQDDLQSRYRRETAFVSTGVTMPPETAARVAPPGREGFLASLGLRPRGYLLFVGRLVPEKGAHLLLEAHRRLETDMPLVIVGDAPHEGRYVQSLRAMAASNAHFLGFRYGDELSELYRGAYLVVLPSATEGIALTLLEAMSHGNAVLVSDIPQNREPIGLNGFTFATGDARDLQRALHTLLTSPEAVGQARERSRAHVMSHYDWEIVTDYFEQLLLTLAGPRHVRKGFATATT